MAKKKLKTGKRELKYEIKVIRTKFGKKKAVLVYGKKNGGCIAVMNSGNTPIVARRESKDKVIGAIRLIFEHVVSTLPQ